jgi:hypothetical protein
MPGEEYQELAVDISKIIIVDTPETVTDDISKKITVDTLQIVTVDISKTVVTLFLFERSWTES